MLITLKAYRVKFTKSTPEGICWTLESVIQLKKSEIQYLESGVHSEKFRIQDCVGLPYTIIMVVNV